MADRASPLRGRSNKDKPASKKSVQNEPNGGLPEDTFSYHEDSRPRTVLPNSVSLCDFEKVTSSAGQFDHVDTAVRTCSRLTKTLHEILHDKDALPYFIQYMDSRQAGQLVRFWLDAQSFQVSALTRVRSRSFNQESKATCTRPDRVVDAPSRLGNQLNTNNSASVSAGGCTRTYHRPDVETTSLSLSSTRSKGSREEVVETAESTSESLCDNPQCKDIQLPSNSVHSNRVIVPQHGCEGNVVQLPARDSNLLNSEKLVSVPNTWVGDPPSGSSPVQSSLSIPTSIGSVSVSGDGATNNNSAHGGSVCQNNIPLPVHSSGSCDAANTKTRIHCNNSGGNRNINGEYKTSTGASDKVLTDNQMGVNMDKHIKMKNSAEISIEQNTSRSHLVSGEESCESVVGSRSTDEELKVKSLKVEGHREKASVIDKRDDSKKSIQDKLLQSIAQDAVRMFSKYIALEATHPIGVTEELRAETIRKICSEDGQVDPCSFVQCQEFVISQMNSLYHADFLLSCYHCKHQFDVLSGSEVYLADFLYNDTAFSYLAEYMEQEGVMPLLQCWLDLDSFQQLLASRQGCYDGLEAQNDAMVIYDKYFSLQATQPLGFSDSLRLEVEGNICREAGPLPDCFCKAKVTVLHVLDKHYFRGFVQSDVYFKYLSDLMNTVQAADIPTATRKRKESDAISTTSDHSSHSVHSEGTTRNTLLAGGKSHGIRKALHKMEDNMQIDGALFNPDALWKRPQSGKMSLGMVDELGRFVSELEIEPDVEKPKLGFLKKRKEKEQTQEEMAAQIAMKIVAGITANSQVGGETGALSSDTYHCDNKSML